MSRSAIVQRAIIRIGEINREINGLAQELEDINSNYNGIIEDIDDVNLEGIYDFTEQLDEIISSSREKMIRYLQLMREKNNCNNEIRENEVNSTIRTQLYTQYNQELRYNAELYTHYRNLNNTYRDFLRDYQAPEHEMDVDNAVNAQGQPELAFNAHEQQNPIQLQQVAVISGFGNIVQNANELLGDALDNPCFCYNGLEAPDDTRDLCRINCPRGHVGHCFCLNRWRNSRMFGGAEQDGQPIYGGWNMYCPVCRNGSQQNPNPPISQIAPVTIAPNAVSFGSKKLKQINNDIKYLKK
jgi:hypothetical protein